MAAVIAPCSVFAHLLSMGCRIVSWLPMATGPLAQKIPLSLEGLY
jgi:hypothetical protein